MEGFWWDFFNMPKVTKNHKAMKNMIEPKKLEFGKKYFFQVLSMCPLVLVYYDSILSS